MNYLIVICALYGLLWPAAGYSQDDEVITLSNDADIRLRYKRSYDDLDTLFVDWSTVYALNVGTPRQSGMILGSGAPTALPAEVLMPVQ